MAKQKPMGKVPSLGGTPAQQAMAGSVSSNSRPMRSPGKPGDSIKGVPPGKASTQTAMKPKGKGKPVLKQGNVKGIKRKAVANLKQS
jgi:hypothetical protein